MRATSKAAKKSIEPKINQLQQSVLRAMKSKGGATCDEIELMTGMRHQTASARIRELYLKDRIKTVGKRQTRSGRMALIWDLN